MVNQSLLRDNLFKCDTIFICQQVDQTAKSDFANKRYIFKNAKTIWKRYRFLLHSVYISLNFKIPLYLFFYIIKQFWLEAIGQSALFWHPCLVKPPSVYSHIALGWFYETGSFTPLSVLPLILLTYSIIMYFQKIKINKSITRVLSHLFICSSFFLSLTLKLHLYL